MPEPTAIADPVVIIAEPIAIAEPSAVADPVVTGRVLTEVNSQEQTTINLCQTISCNSTPLNVLFDSGATMTLVNKKVAEMGIRHEIIKYELNTIGNNCFEGCGAVQVPLALPDGKARVLKALVVDEPLGQVDMHPPPPLVLWHKFLTCQWMILRLGMVEQWTL
jgi:Retroviral aspartyl protease